MPQNPREGLGGGESEEAGTSSLGLKGSEHLEVSSVFKAQRFQGGAGSNHPSAHHPRDQQEAIYKGPGFIAESVSVARDTLPVSRTIVESGAHLMGHKKKKKICR